MIRGDYRRNYGRLQKVIRPRFARSVAARANMWQGLGRVMIAAGLKDKAGEPKYGIHAFRHFYASWCINRKEDGGMELPPKVVQERLGHSSILMTMDTYGHLFPRGDDTAALAAAEKALLA